MADTGCRLPVCELEPTPDSEIKLRDTWHWPNREVTAMADLQDDFDRSVAIHARPVDTGHRDD